MKILGVLSFNLTNEIAHIYISAIYYVISHTLFVKNNPLI